MEVIDNKLIKVYRREHEGRTYYSIRLSKKDKDGNYINGYIDARFKKDIEVEDRTNIYIKNAWLDFYVKDKKTYPYIFINEFEKVKETIEKAEKEVKEENINAKNMTFDDEELPF